MLLFQPTLLSHFEEFRTTQSFAAGGLEVKRQSCGPIEKELSHTRYGKARVRATGVGKALLVSHRKVILLEMNFIERDNMKYLALKNGRMLGINDISINM